MNSIALRPLLILVFFLVSYDSHFAEERILDNGKIKVKSKKITAKELEEAIAKEEQEAREKYSKWPTVIRLDIPLNILPLDRFDRFETPVEEALAGDGIVESAGSSAVEKNGKIQVTSVGITLRVRNLDSSLVRIKKTLKAKKAPPETEITVEDNPPKTYVLGK